MVFVECVAMLFLTWLGRMGQKDERESSLVHEKQRGDNNLLTQSKASCAVTMHWQGDMAEINQSVII